MAEELAVPTKEIDLQSASLAEVQQAFVELDASVKLAEPQIDAMRRTYEEAQMLLDDMKYRRGKAAYWLTIRKAQR